MVGYIYIMSEENKQNQDDKKPEEAKKPQGKASSPKKDQVDPLDAVPSGARKWKEVLAALERKLAEEREIFQQKFKEIKEAHDSLRTRLENRERELSLELGKYKESSKVGDEKRELITRKHKEDVNKLNDEWEARLKAKENEIFSVRNELNVVHGRDEEEARSLRQQQYQNQEESRRHLDRKDKEIVLLSEERARLQGKIVQRETELKAEFERTIFDMEKRTRSALESEINRLKISFEQEKTVNEVLQIKLKEMATMRSDLEFKETQIKSLYNEKHSVEKMRKDVEEDLQNAKIDFDKERVGWGTTLDERNSNIRDLLRDKDSLNNQEEAFKREIKENQLKNEAREREWDRQKSEFEDKVVERSKRITDLEADLIQNRAQIESLLREKQAEQEKIDKALSSDLNRVLARLELERSTLEADMGNAISGNEGAPADNKPEGK